MSLCIFVVIASTCRLQCTWIWYSHSHILFQLSTKYSRLYTCERSQLNIYLDAGNRITKFCAVLWSHRCRRRGEEVDRVKERKYVISRSDMPLGLSLRFHASTCIVYTRVTITATAYFIPSCEEQPDVQHPVLITSTLMLCPI